MVGWLRRDACVFDKVSAAWYLRGKVFGGLGERGGVWGSGMGGFGRGVRGCGIDRVVCLFEGWDSVRLLQERFCVEISSCPSVLVLVFRCVGSWSGGAG